jgi:hypothetical protein
MRNVNRRTAAVWFAAAALGLGGVLAALPAHAATAVNFYVSPTGSDSNDGASASTPFRTLTKAQAAVRGVDQSTAGPITVNLAGGDYRLTAPLAFTAADSGTVSDVTWQAESGAFPVIWRIPQRTSGPRPHRVA